MTFRWLPDSETYAHPRLSWLIECGFDITINALYRRENMLPRKFRLPPGTLIVSNHRRDSDAPILATMLCGRDGLHLHGELPFFAMREDLLQRNALANLLASWPRPLARLLGLIPMKWFFRNVRARPMRRLREFTWRETVQDLLAVGLQEADPAVVFNARGQHELIEQLGKLPPRLADIDPRRLGNLQHAPWGLRRLRSAALRRLEPEFRTTISAQLEHFATLLDAGHSLYFAPEGGISFTGRFGRIRGGTRRLYRMAHPSTMLLPFALSYDALGPGRMRVIIRMGEPLHGLDASDARGFAADLRHAIMKVYAVNPSHLIACFLSTGPEQFTTREFAEWLQRAAAAVAAAGLTLDPLFTRRSPQVLASERLRWLRRKKLLTCHDTLWRNDWPRDAVPGWGEPAGIVRYLANALDDLSPELVRTLQP